MQKKNVHFIKDYNFYLSLLSFHSTYSYMYLHTGNIPLTMSSAVLDAMPAGLRAWHKYCPTLSSFTSGTVRDTRPFLYEISKSAFSVMSRPSRNHLMLGSGLPVSKGGKLRTLRQFMKSECTAHQKTKIRSPNEDQHPQPRKVVL